MLGVSVTTDGVSCLRRELESGVLDAAAARRACDELLQRSDLAEMGHLVHGEAVALLVQYRALVEGRAVAKGARKSLSAWIERRTKSLEARWQGRPCDELVLEPGMASTVVELCRALDKTADADPMSLVRPPIPWRGLDRFSSHDPLRQYFVGAASWPVMQRALRMEAVTRLARVALAVAEHRAMHGEFPGSLDDVRWAFPDGVPTDPYANSGFTYSRVGAGARISSAGPPPEAIEFDRLTARERLLLWELSK